MENGSLILDLTVAYTVLLLPLLFIWFLSHLSMNSGYGSMSAKRIVMCSISGYHCLILQLANWRPYDLWEFLINNGLGMGMSYTFSCFFLALIMTISVSSVLTVSLVETKK